ncbi:MAG TPA: superoxide dismutase [Bacteroidales bacterium]|nr:superoxide dismutase [Bacteroidales bacterium]
MERRKFITTVGFGVVAASIPTKILGAKTMTTFEDFITKGNEFVFPQLAYSYDSLEPYIDKMTMEIHYDRHHRGYFTKFMNDVEGSDLKDKSFSEIFAGVSKLSAGVKNNGGGFYNHTLFWNNMSPEKSKPSKELLKEIESSFGSFEKFKETFSNAAATRFGSGWAWLVMTADKKLAVGSTPNQENPLMDVSSFQGAPLLTLDVWEHAYYLKYQNKRADYIEAFWNVVNWDEVNRRFER